MVCKIILLAEMVKNMFEYVMLAPEGRAKRRTG